MADDLGINFSLLGRIFAISGKKIFRWYQNSSGYSQQKAETKRAYENRTGKPRKKLSKNLILRKFKKIWKPDNFGEKMGIDEKFIGGKFYTILINLKTKKIAAVIASVKGSEIKQCLYSLPQNVRWGVKTLTRDLAMVFQDVGTEIFVKAMHVADKFHVIKQGLEALQAIRIRYRQLFLTAERERTELHKCQEAQRRDECKKLGQDFVPQKIPSLSLLENGETELQLLARSRYLLFKFKSEWNDDQVQRAKILFKKYPDLKTAHSLITKFRNFYKLAPDKNIPKAREKLNDWIKEVGAVDIPEIQNFASMVSRHRNVILAYFENGDTNALAESINNKIQRFIINNHGSRDHDFLFFRLQKFLS